MSILVKIFSEGAERIVKFADDMPLNEIRTALQKKFTKPEVAEGINKLRMQRASDMGATPDISYHGTGADIKSFDKSKFGSSTGANSAEQGVWSVSDPSTARGYGEYAAKDAKVKKLLNDADNFEKKGDWDGYDRKLVEAEKLEQVHIDQPLQGQNIMPLRTKGNFHTVDMDGAEYMDAQDEVNSIIKEARSNGFDGVKFDNLADDVGFNSRPATHTLTFDPKNIRSINADFDPSKASSSNLLASKLAPVAVGSVGLSALTEEDAEAGVAGKMIKGWHGSPYDFKKFKLDSGKVGTGRNIEGYGHYLTESESSAVTWRDFAKDKFNSLWDRSRINGKKYDDFLKELNPDERDLIESATELVTDGFAGRHIDELEIGDDATEFLRDVIEMDDFDLYLKGDEFQPNTATRDSLSKKIKSFQHEDAPGKIYEVDFDANESSLLDWDSSLSSQSIPEGLYPEGISGNSSGKELYAALEDNLGSSKLASEYLNKEGVPGIKFKKKPNGDMSGPQNYVAFDDKLLSIAKKYGIAPAAVTSAMIASEDETFADTMNTMSNEIPLRSENNAPLLTEDEINAIANKRNIEPWFITPEVIIEEQAEIAMNKAYKDGSYSQVKPIADGWRGAAFDTGMWLDQNLDSPLGGTWFENAGELLMNVGADQKKDLLSWWWDSILAASDVAP